MDKPGVPVPTDGEIAQRAPAMERAGGAAAPIGPAGRSSNGGRGGKGGGANPPPGRGGPARRNPPSRESEGRRPRPDARRPTYAFGDEIERAFCAAFRGRPAQTFPVTTHEGLATRRPTPVDRRPDAVLFCDGAHPGLHVWPDGEVVEQDTGAVGPSTGQGSPAQDGGSPEPTATEQHESGGQ